MIDILAWGCLPSLVLAVGWVVRVLWVAQSERTVRRRAAAERARLHTEFEAIVSASLADLEHKEET